MEDHFLSRITIPDATLDVLTFCPMDDLAGWVGGLPMANTDDTAERILAAANEISKLRVDDRERLLLLEAIRPTVHYVCARLDRRALGPRTADQHTAHMAQRLQTTLCLGYKVAIAGMLQAAAEAKDLHQDDLSLAIHRAMSDMSRTMLRSLQLYVAPGQNLWLELNQLYSLSERLALTEIKHRDTENHSSTSTRVVDAFVRALLLASAKPNQLRHRSLMEVFNALELWTTRVAVDPDTRDARFLVDLESNRGPVHTRLIEKSGEFRALRTDVLTYEIEAYLKEIESGVPIPDYLSDDLLTHLANAWGTMTARAHRRVRSDVPIKVCVGLRSIHYILSGGVDFSDQLSGTEALLRREINPFLDNQPSAQNAPDIWDSATKARIPHNPNIEDPDRILLGRAGATEQDNPLHYSDTIAIDTSPGGYRLQWQGEIATNLQVGELLAVREASDLRWCIAVARWISQGSGGTELGVELISPRAIPVASRVIQKKGGPTDFARALLLPAMETIGEPARLLTPSLPFQPMQKVHVQRQGIQTTAQLSECTLSTESFKQFTFRLLDGYLENSQIDLNMDAVSEMIGADRPPKRD